MDEKKDHFRAPVSNAFRRKSPFRQLLLHMKKVRKCIDTIEEGLVKYYKGDYKSFSDLTERVSKIEHEADLIKRNIRNHLPKTVFMPVDKGKFLWASTNCSIVPVLISLLILFINIRLIPVVLLCELLTLT